MSENSGAIDRQSLQTLAEATLGSLSLTDAIGIIAGATDGAVLLSQLAPETVLPVVLAASEECNVYFLHRDASVLRAAYQSTLRTKYAHRVLYFHGHSVDFFRNLPLHPAVACVVNGGDALSVWGELPAGAALVVNDTFREEDHWVDAGFLERIRTEDSYRVFRASGRFQRTATDLPADVFQRCRAQLATRYFHDNKLVLSAATTPCETATESARQWRRGHEPPAVGGYGEWPYVASPTPLPDTLPGGERWPLISVVTPSYNQGQYIEETILSVARQGYPRVEHIVMDGGSQDSTVSVMERYRHCLAAAISEKDKGQSNAINKGMALATGDILTWLNSDDMLAPGALAGVAMGFHTSRADLVAGIVTLRSGGRTVAHHMTCCEPGPLPLDDLLDLDGGWNAGQFFYQPEVMFSRDIWERAGAKVREDLYYSMDYDLWVRMAEAGGRIHVIGRSVAWFRIHEEQKTNAETKFKAELSRYVEEFYQRTGRPRRPSRAHKQPRHQLRVAMLNDHGFRYGAGIAHQRMADSMALAGHTVLPMSLRAEPGYTGEPTHLTAAEVEEAVSAARPDMIIAGNIHSAGPDPWQLGILAEKYPTMSVLHDFWLLTGRCAYPTPCEKYLTGCDDTCPTADQYPKLAPALIAEAWERKQKLLLGNNQLMLLGNSAWTSEFARKTMQTAGGGRSASPVGQFRLNFPLDVFQPKDRRTCRAILGLPQDRFLVLLTGDLYDKRKNTQLVLEALESLDLPDLTVVSLGQKRDGESFTLPDIRRLGHVTDMTLLTNLFSAADLFVGPSQEETFGQVFIEAIACGTPAIGVRASGMAEAVVEGVTGLLADGFEPETLASVIYYLYARPELRRKMALWGRIYVENEWSPQASYYHLFRAWRQLGLLDSLQLPPKIGFVANQPETPECKPIHRVEGITMRSSSLGPEEGPYEEYGLPKFRWAYGPKSRVLVHSQIDGSHSLVLRYRNMHPGQMIGVTVNGVAVGSYPLIATGLKEGRMLCLPVKLREGDNEVEMEFTRWDDTSNGGRPLAAAITELSFLPDPVLRPGPGFRPDPATARPA
ncbi:MAG: glycosyltransferase [Acidobacteria bacterium]|nr:glycosyltransferase [Acidobacteriota bacterium]